MPFSSTANPSAGDAHLLHRPGVPAAARGPARRPPRRPCRSAAWRRGHLVRAQSASTQDRPCRSSRRLSVLRLPRPGGPPRRGSVQVRPPSPPGSSGWSPQPIRGSIRCTGTPCLLARPGAGAPKSSSRNALRACVRACVHAYLPACRRACVPACVCSRVRAFVRSCVRALVHSCTRALVPARTLAFPCACFLA